MNRTTESFFVLAVLFVNFIFDHVVFKRTVEQILHCFCLIIFKNSKIQAEQMQNSRFIMVSGENMGKIDVVIEAVCCCAVDYVTGFLVNVVMMVQSARIR